MAKNSMTKKQALEDFDFSDVMESSYEDEVINGMLGNLMEAMNHQMRIAFDLTKLIIEKNSSANFTEENILAVFKRASKAVAENLPMKPLWDKLGESN